MSAPKRILHFTLGPVQGFIADARRTRDLWAGSFLLSWLSGHAMAALDEAGGKIIFPEVAGDDLFEAIRNGRIGSAPYVGSLPNRFKADISDVKLPAGIANAGELCRQAIVKNWGLLEKAVYKQFIAWVANNETQEIWTRQVKHFWDMNWVIGEEAADDGKWLDQRKNWRTHLGPDEGGDLCRLMGRYQEISGFHRIGGKSEQEKFWTELSGADGIGPLNLRPDERLCAIALIKRLFPLIAKDVIGWSPGGGDPNIINWPSVSYIAAVPWLKAVGEVAKEESKKYSRIVTSNVTPGFKGETETKLFGLPKNGLFKLDGHLLHQDGIRAWNVEDLKEGESTRKKLLAGLKAIKKKTGGSASEFYAVLVMDGDQIGAKIVQHPNTIKTGLAIFTNSVKEYFSPSNGNPANGVLIYAGGDDVLALVPVDGAILAARELRKKYQEAFEASITKNPDEQGKLKCFTMSAAIVFAQYKIPLRTVLKKAHHYLDDIAKDKNGRDSLAIAVMKPGGIAYDWVSCWKKEVDPVKTMEEIAMNGAGKNPEYSSSFFYNIRERYAPLFEGDDPSEEQDIEDASFMEAVLAAEYKKQPGKSKLSFEKAKAATEPLLTIGRPLRRKSEEPEETKDYSFDGALVAHFLSVEGRWNMGAKE